jgi:hypothetical protein
VSARLWTALRGHGAGRASVAALLSLLLSLRQALADEQRVTIACPQLDREGVAELESLARAALLTANLRASLAIACRAEGVLVTAQSAESRASVSADLESATFRDGVLAAVDDALEQLRGRETPAAPASASAVEQPAPKVAPPPGPQPKVMAPPASEPKPAPRAAPVAVSTSATPQAPSRSSTFHSEFFGAAGLEAWSAGLAGTATLGARRGGRYVWLGVRGGLARQLAQDTEFTATELSLALEAVLVPVPAFGLRAALSVGPSLLVVSPSARVTAVNDVKTAALLVGADVSRPVWLGRFAVVPTVGVRVFARERGVRLDGSERLVLAGYQPSVALGLAYLVD